MAIFKNEQGQELDTSKYTNLQGQEAINWAQSQDLFKGYSAVPDTPAIKPNVISASAISGDNNANNVILENQKRNDILNNIKNTYSKYTGEAGANDAFIQGVALYKTGQKLTPEQLTAQGITQGMKIKDVLNKFGIMDKMDDFGINKPEAPKLETENPKLETTKTSSVADTLDEMIKNLTFDRTQANKDAGVPELQTAATKVRAELDAMQNEMGLNNVLQTTNIAKTKEDYYAQKDAIEGQAIPMTEVNKQLGKLTDTTNIALDKESIAQAVADATNTYKYNSKLIEYNIVSSNLQAAQALVQQTAQDFKDFNTQKLNILQFQNQITQQDQALLQKEIDREYEMATSGYTYISSPSALQELAKTKGTDWVKENTINIGGKIYIKPIQEAESKITYGKIGTDANGNDIYGFIDTANQKITPVQNQDGSIANLPPVGSVGGQCGEYINKLMGTSVGDSWESKQQIANIDREDFIKAPQVGDVVIFQTKMPYGHIAAVAAVNGNQITITESNWNNDEKVGTRTISANDPSITGIYRGATLPVKQSQYSDTAISYAKDILGGKIGIENVPGEKMKNEVMLAKQELEKTQKPLADQLIAEGLQDKIDGFDSLLDHKGMKGTVGAYAIARWTPFSPDKAERQDFIAGVEQLIQQETIDKLIQSKAAGATYGALSDGEREMLSKAASKIGTWRIKDGDQVVGYEISEELMKKELTTIRDLANKAKERILGETMSIKNNVSDDEAYALYQELIKNNK